MPSTAAAHARRALNATLFVLFALVLTVASQARLFMTGRASGLPQDGDGWARMVRVRQLWEGGSWYDIILPNLSAPEGLSLHWTRPLDVLIIVPAWIAVRFGAEPQDALIWAGALICPLLLFFTALAAGWAARIAWPELPYAAYYAVLLIFAYGILVSYSVTGRADHHVLVVLAAILGLGFACRATWADRPRRAAWYAGAAFGFGIWVAPETLMIAIPVMAAFGLGWALSAQGASWAAEGRRTALGMAGMIAVAIMVERRPADWLAVEYDKVSLHHLFMALLIAGVFVAAGRLPALRLPLRLLAGAALAGVATGVLLLVNPGALGSSMSSADAAAATLLLPIVQEMQPIVPNTPLGIAHTLEFMGLAPAAILAAAAAIWRGRRDGQWVRGAALLLAVLATLVATAVHRRFGTNLAGVSAVAAAGLMGMIARTTWPVVTRVPVMLAAVALLFGAPYLAQGFYPRGDEVRIVAIPRGCSGIELTNWLLALGRDGDVREAPIVMTSDINQTPELAWRTFLRYVGAAYHRGGPAIADTVTFFGAEDEATARAVLARRPVQYVLVCAETYAGNGPFARRLTSDDVPDWLEAVPPPEGHEPGKARLFRVR